jgi:protein arginine N-methyltransferase 5
MQFVTDPWETWNKIRSLAEHHASLSVALELTSDLPDQSTVEQWGAEPVRLVILPTVRDACYFFYK